MVIIYNNIFYIIYLFSIKIKRDLSTSYLWTLKFAVTTFFGYERQVSANPCLSIFYNENIHSSEHYKRIKKYIQSNINKICKNSLATKVLIKIKIYVNIIHRNTINIKKNEIVFKIIIFSSRTFDSILFFFLE